MVGLQFELTYLLICLSFSFLGKLLDHGSVATYDYKLVCEQFEGQKFKVSIYETNWLVISM